jgi:hypothetical protein
MMTQFGCHSTNGIGTNESGPNPKRCGLISIAVIETFVVVGKPYDSLQHPAASVLLDEILVRSDCAGLNGAERRLLGGRANS